MTKDRSEFVEFSLYHEILNGCLNPFLLESISDQKFRSILDEVSPGIIAEEIQNFSDGYFKNEKYEIPNSYNLFKSEDRQDILSIVREVEDYQNYGQGLQKGVESKEQHGGRFDNAIQNEIELDQNSPLLSLKVCQFKALIQNEFEGIKQRALDLKNFSVSEDELKSVVSRNIEKAQKLATDASELRNQLQTGALNGGEPNAFIVDMVRYFLLHSIIFYQHHFGPYIDRELISNDELKATFNQGKACWPIIKRLEEVQIYGTNEHAETSSPYIVPTDVNGNHFVLKGDFWEVSYDGNETTIRNLERVRYIVRLLESPNRDFHCHELVSLVKGYDSDNYFHTITEIDPIESDDRADASEGNIHLVDPTEDEISREDLAACLNIANDLWQEAKNPNNLEEERAKAEEAWKKAKNHFSNEYGLFFIESNNGGLQPRILKRLQRDFERCRTNVRNQISRAMSDISEKIPSFYVYLKNHIQTGIKCSFRPDPEEEDKRWTIDWGF